MNIELINYTQNAAELLILSKNTRHLSSSERFEDIMQMSSEEKDREISYIFSTISSSWEFVGYTFLLQDVTRAFTHQLVRHRIGTSFAQESLRVSPQENFSYLIPDGIESDAFQVRLYEVGMANIQESYNLLLGKGADTQDARGILPTNICTNILLGINLRALSLLMETRLCIRAQGEFQEAALWMKDLVLLAHPWIPYRTLMPACISKGVCLFPRFNCPLKNKYEHLKQVDDKLTKEVESDWVKMIEANYSPQPKQSK